MSQADAQYTLALIETKVPGYFVRVVMAGPDVDSFRCEGLSQRRGTVLWVSDGNCRNPLREPGGAGDALDLHAGDLPQLINELLGQRHLVGGGGVIGAFDLVAAFTDRSGLLAQPDEVVRRGHQAGEQLGLRGT